jgi:hypothetical protein
MRTDGWLEGHAMPDVRFIAVDIRATSRVQRGLVVKQWPNGWRWRDVILERVGPKYDSLDVTGIG